MNNFHKGISRHVISKLLAILFKLDVALLII